jgi:hypothetical protein
MAGAYCLPTNPSSATRICVCKTETTMWDCDSAPWTIP